MADALMFAGWTLLPVFVALYLCTKIFPRRSRTLKLKISAFLGDKVMKRLHLKCVQQKLELFKSFENLCDGSTPHILEIGVGSGRNLAFLPKRCTLSCLEPNLENRQYVSQALLQFRDIRLDKFVGGFAENMQEFDDNSFDAVVCTFTLCTVRQPDKALKEVKRVLKPGGSFFFMEHVAAPRSTVLRDVQNWMQMLWPKLAEGCNLTRETWTLVEEAEFSSVQLTHFTIKERTVLAFVKTCIYGVAVK